MSVEKTDLYKLNKVAQERAVYILSHGASFGRGHYLWIVRALHQLIIHCAERCSSVLLQVPCNDGDENDELTR